MKKPYKNSLFIAVAIALYSNIAIAQERDPFSPTGGNVGVMGKMRELVTGDQPLPQENNFNSADPLTSTQLVSYKVIGVMVSDNQKLASVKAMNGVSYLVKVGDSIGSEGGKITDIATDGIKVQSQDKEIKLPVNNKLEVPLDAAKTQ